MTIREICELFRSRDASRFAEASAGVITLATQPSLSAEDTADLASALAASGETIVLPEDLAPFADVASSGGPTSLTTLLCPLILATAGVGVPKISATGSVAGAIDVLGLIPGFRTDLDRGHFIEALSRGRIAHVLQTDEICPADRSLLAARRERGMVASAPLIVSSLLAKKLVVPGTAGIFDFRLGEAGNVLRHPNVLERLDEARRVGDLMLEVARILQLAVGVALTDGSTHYCSALGRLESLSLLVRLLKGEELENSIDGQHRQTCLDLASQAVSLARGSTELQLIRRELESLLSRRAVWRTFLKHLELQGGSLRGLEEVLDVRLRLSSITVRATSSGYWVPASVSKAKAWIKSAQGRALAALGLQSSDPHSQLGVRLLASPGDQVSQGQAVTEVRFPKGLSIEVPVELFQGTTVRQPPVHTPQLLEFLSAA